MGQPVYGTRRIYADIPGEGQTSIRTLIAVPGQRISPSFEHLVPDDAKTTVIPSRTRIHQAATVDHPTSVPSASGTAVAVDRAGQEVVEVVDVVPPPAADAEPVVPAGELKGEALDDALEEAGLSKAGTADEKRDRLAAFQQGAGEAA
jgi:hypothetical protein